MARPSLAASIALTLLAACAHRETAVPVPPAACALTGTAPPATPWSHLRARYDRNGDGRIEAGEYPRSEQSFRNLDRDRDGVITAGDLEIPPAMPPDLVAPFILVRRFAGPEADAIAIADIGEAFESVDLDRDGAMDRAEFHGGEPPPGPDRFLALTTAADRDGDGRLSLAEIESWAAARDRDGDGRLSRRERMKPGTEPKVGWFPVPEREKAPEFSLPREDGSGMVRLSSFAGKRPVALIFGSYT
jgi:hypothetical protein